MQGIARFLDLKRQTGARAVASRAEAMSNSQIHDGPVSSDVPTEQAAGAAHSPYRLAINNNLSPVPAYGVNPTICRFVPSFDILRAKLEATVHPILGGSCSTVTAEGSTAGKVCVAKAWQKCWTTSADI